MGHSKEVVRYVRCNMLLVWIYGQPHMMYGVARELMYRGNQRGDDLLILSLTSNSVYSWLTKSSPKSQFYQNGHLS